MKNTNYTNYIIAGIVITGVGYYAYQQIKNSNKNEQPDGNTQVVDETIPLPPTINKNLIMQIGSKGLEVKELQKLMSLSDDGIFGKQTESKLLSLKGVKKISLTQYKATVTINTNAYAISTNIMSENINGTAIYNAIKKADNSYYTDNQVLEKISFGQKIGKIIGFSALKTWYLVEQETFFGKRIVFVKAVDVKKI